MLTLRVRSAFIFIGIAFTLSAQSSRGSYQDEIVMAQSRPPPIRTQSAFPSNTTTSTSHSHSHSHSQSHASPPLSPRTQGHGEKKHHSRRKSGREGERFVVVSEKKRPSTLSRRTTPVVLPKRRDRERDRDSFVEEDGAGSGESFPQFW